MSDYEAIVVGAGCAGTVAAYELAKAGKSVLLVERGNFAGAKNMSGGRIYVHSLRKVFPEEILNECPFERRITHERISLMAPDSNFTIDFSSEEMKKEGRESYSVLRSVFDQWLAEQAEGAGADCIFGIPIESLLKDETGKVIGVVAGEDEITADVVILADGVNSLLAKEAVGAKRPIASQVAVGVKEVFALPEDTITNRVLADSSDDGAAWLFVGDATHGTFGGGFMYTNRESISLGIVAGIEATATKGKASVTKMLADMKSHPGVAPLIKDAHLVEHSGHMVPEGGLQSMPEFVGDGVLIAGDAAMMCINLGYMVRGMDYAVASGQMAAQASIRAIDRGDTSKKGLEHYRELLESSFVMQDLRQFSNVPQFMAGFDRMFGVYPEMIRDIMNSLFVIDGAPVRPMKKTLRPIVKGVGTMNIARDGLGALKAL